MELPPTLSHCVSSLPLRRAVAGFTLLELLIVVAIVAVASAGVTFALRDSGQARLEREAVRLAALLESARARSLASGVPVRWRATATGFVFDGLPPGTLPEGWLNDDVRAVPALAGSASGSVNNAAGGLTLLLGPEPMLPPQSLQLASTQVTSGAIAQRLTVSSDGVRPFSVQAAQAHTP